MNMDKKMLSERMQATYKTLERNNQIRKLALENVPQADIARMFKLTRQRISFILGKK